MFTLKRFWFDVGYVEVFDVYIDRLSDNEKDAPTGCDALSPVSLSRILSTCYDNSTRLPRNKMYSYQNLIVCLI